MASMMVTELSEKNKWRWAVSIGRSPGVRVKPEQVGVGRLVFMLLYMSQVFSIPSLVLES